MKTEKDQSLPIKICYKRIEKLRLKPNLFKTCKNNDTDIFQN